MIVLVKSTLISGKDVFENESKGIFRDNKIIYYDDYKNIFNIDNLTLERESSDIHSLFDYNKSKATYFIKQLNSNLDISMKVLDTKIDNNEIVVEYIIKLEEDTKCKYILSWRNV